MGIHQTSENGTIEINDHVLKQIIYDAVSEIEGIQIVSNRIIDHFFKFFSKSDCEVIGLNIKNEKDINATICIGIKYNLDLPARTKEIQNIVKEKVMKTANISLNRIDIHILNLDRGAL